MLKKTKHIDVVIVLGTSHRMGRFRNAKYRSQRNLKSLAFDLDEKSVIPMRH